MKNLIFLIIVTVLVFTSCDDKKIPFNDHQDDRKKVFNLDSVELIIRTKTDSFSDAHITGDTSYLNNCFSQGARIFPPGMAIVEGEKAISALNAEWVSYDIHEFKEISSRFYGNSKYLIDEGTYAMKYGPDSISDEGKYVNIWINQNGEWKIYSNIWNGAPN